MEHVAIDLGGRKSQVCVRAADGRVLKETSWPTGDLERLLAGCGKSRVVVETCAEGFCIADVARELGHEVRVVPATLVRSLGVGARGIKTDVRDARVLSEVSTRIDLPSVHIPQAESREAKSLLGMREALVRARTQLINTARGWLRRHVKQVGSGGAETFTQRVRAMSTQEILPSYVVRQLDAIDALSCQICAADEDLEAWVKRSPVALRLMTVPGVGPVTALRFVTALDTAQRFGDAHAVESYLGLTPGEHSSSAKQRRTGITKAGAPAVRWTLIQAAWVLRRTRPGDPMVKWSIAVERRRGKRVAIVALARKLAGLLFALWRDGSTYNPMRAAQPQTDSAMT